ncbi:MAG: ABC transporter ATP-binding protein [Anaerolineales bacterium]|nr:ABC transporter ATP-binding protein [Anaerolineales bacterium]
MGILLDIQDLHVEVDGESVLQGVNLAVPEGEVHALLGPNGSGKTSLMMTIMGFSRYTVTSGKILFDGKDITHLGLTERARLGIAVSQQRPPTIDGVQLQQVLDYAVGSEVENRHRVDELIDTLNMEAFITRDINAGLSGGEIKRSELLQLLATRPRFAMLDEPDSGVDLEALEKVGWMVNQLYSLDPQRPALRKTGLIITHTAQVLDYVQIDKAHVMIDHRIASCGNPGLILDTISQHGYSACLECMQLGRCVETDEDLLQIQIDK